MNYPVPRRSSPDLPRRVSREHQIERAEVRHQAALAEDQVAAIGLVAKRAMVESGDINMLRRVADRIAPEAGELTAMIAVAAAIEMTNVINGMGRGL